MELLFSRIDKDNDGRITSKEFFHAMTGRRKEALQADLASCGAADWKAVARYLPENSAALSFKVAVERAAQQADMVSNLMKRYPMCTQGQVEDALDSSAGHAGKAAGILYSTASATVSALFSQLDSDGDGVVTGVEFNHALTGNRKRELRQLLKDCGVSDWTDLRRELAVPLLSNSLAGGVSKISSEDFFEAVQRAIP